jgi:hypothetical protein
LTGQGVAMGVQTGCVLAYATRWKSCNVCDHARKKGKNQGDMTAEKSWWVIESNGTSSCVWFVEFTRHQKC